MRPKGLNSRNLISYFSVLSVLIILGACTLSPVAQSQSEEPSSQGLKSKIKKEAQQRLNKNSETPKKVESEALGLIRNAVGNYRSSSGVQMNLKKTVYLALMDQTRVSQGSLLFAKDKLRMQIDKPDDSLLVMDTKVIWLENKLPEDLGGKTQVVKMRVSANQKKGNALLAILFGDENVWDELKVVDEKNDLSSLQITLKPKRPEKLPDIGQMTIELDSARQKILKVSYLDELENKTTYDFENVKVGIKIAKSKFQYSPPKSAEITEY